MRTGGVTLAVFIVLVAPAATAQVPLSFLSPGHYGGDLDVGGAEWLLLVFRGGEAEAVLDAGGPVDYTNHSVVRASVDVPDVARYHDVTQLPSQQERMGDGLEARVTMQGAWSSLYVEAERIHLAVGAADGSLSAADGGKTVGEHASKGWPPGTSRFEVQRPALGAVVAEAAGARVLLEVEGLRLAEWHNATVVCPAGADCPGDAVSTDASAGDTGAWVYRYGQVVAGNGTLALDAEAWSVVLGGTALDASVEGWARLPQVQWRDCADGCPALEEDRTLLVEGDIALQGVGVEGGNRIGTTLEGDVVAARLDEEWVPASALVGAAVGSVVGLALLAKLVAWVLAAKRRRDVLANPNRRRLFEEVVASPGSTLRGAAEAAGLVFSTARYHARILEERGLIVMKPYRNSLRLYENHGRHEATWRSRAALREGPLRTLLEWIDAHPGATQARIVREAQAWHWPRSTALHRLRRLLDEGFIVETRRSGRPRYRSVLARRH